jgi:2-keto-3-deoxy-L-rhamnonate aldolase RhmA
MKVVKTANDETVLILQMESVEAYEQADEILALDGFDVLLVGPMDLSASLGVTADMQNPKVQTIMEEMPKRAEGTGKIIGTTLGNPDEIRQKIDWGYKFLNLGTPLGYGIRFVNDRFVEYREQAGQ